MHLTVVKSQVRIAPSYSLKSPGLEVLQVLQISPNSALSYMRSALSPVDNFVTVVDSMCYKTRGRVLFMDVSACSQEQIACNTSQVLRNEQFALFDCALPFVLGDETIRQL